MLAIIIEMKTDKIVSLDEFDLINFLRSKMVPEILKEYSLVELLPKKPKVKLNPVKPVDGFNK